MKLKTKIAFKLFMLALFAIVSHTVTAQDGSKKATTQVDKKEPTGSTTNKEIKKEEVANSKDVPANSSGVRNDNIPQPVLKEAKSEAQPKKK